MPALHPWPASNRTCLLLLLCFVLKVCLNATIFATQGCTRPEFWHSVNGKDFSGVLFTTKGWDDPAGACIVIPQCSHGAAGQQRQQAAIQGLPAALPFWMLDRTTP